MFPDAPPNTAETPYDSLSREFVMDVRSQLSQLTGEIAMRNNRIQENDAYIYGDLLERMLDVPVGHDKTSVNWLRRAVEIHRAQFMGKGFTIASTYNSVDVDSEDDPDKKKLLQIQSDKLRAYSEKRKELIDAIQRDNGGDTLWAQCAENASAIGDTILKAWYDEKEGKYCIVPVESVEHCYALWKRDNFREWDVFSYVYQVDKQTAENTYNVGPDVQTSPLGMPLAVLSTANTIEYISTQPMVTIMEVTGTIQGWASTNGILRRVEVGSETPMNVVVVGTHIHKLIDDESKMPKYYHLPNKKQRRRPWGMPDISKHAVNINLTYVETLSDWRTLSSKVNFPKFKYFGFPTGSQMPKPKARTVEGIPLVEGQDVQPLEMPNSAQIGEKDFPMQLEEMKNEFVRETGIGRVLFDDPDLALNSNQALQTSMKSIGDITATKQQLWSPVIIQIFEDALQTLAKYDSDINEVVTEDKDWYLRMDWPSMLNKDDPVYHTMLLNRFNAGVISLQSYLEGLGENAKEELDRLTDELDNPVYSAIHGHVLSALAQMKFFPPATVPPKVSLNLRGDLTPEQEGNLAYMHGFNQGPFGTSAGPQGNEGLRATDEQVNQGFQTPGTNPQAIQQGPNGQPMPYTPGVASAQPSAPAQQGTPANNVPGSQPVSQPGSGAPQVTPQGNQNQQNQRHGK